MVFPNSFFVAGNHIGYSSTLVHDWLAGFNGGDLSVYSHTVLLGAVLRKRRTALRTAAESDQRISLMTQVLSGIRTIKAHAWEDEYREMIKCTRR